MRELWTGNLVGQMHLYGIKKGELAERLGVTQTYVGMILKGSRTPPHARERFEKAVNEIIAEKLKGAEHGADS